MTFDAKAFLATLTELPGVYRMLDVSGAVLYVGKAKNLRKRVSSYFRENLASPRIAHMVSQIANIEITSTRTEAEALLLENNLIKSLAPKYNIVFRDDKSYPYIVLSRDSYPKLGFFRGNPDRKSEYFGPFPSASAVRESIQLLQKIFRLRTCENPVFNNRTRPCLLHQIKRCSAPCTAAINPEDYAADVRLAQLFLQGKQSEVIRNLTLAMESAATSLAFEQAAFLRDQIRSLQKVAERQYIDSGKAEDVDIIVAMEEGGTLCVNLAMVRGGRHLGDRAFFPGQAEGQGLNAAISAFVSQHYAAHPLPARLLVTPLHSTDDDDHPAEILFALSGRTVPVGDARLQHHRAWQEMASQNARLAILARQQSSQQQEMRLTRLQSLLGLPEVPARIECFDISHTQGEAAVASCVVYAEGGMKRSDYRRFNMRDILPGDDYGAMRQAVSRRYDAVAAGEGVAPDLVLIDGGKGQVGAAVAALEELGLPDMVVLGVAKGEGRKPGLESLIFPDGREPLQLPSEEPALHLIQEIRDEAHRFALTGHRARRAKARRVSSLDEITGVGPAKRKALLTRFGSLQGIRAASTEQLADVPGIGPALAANIHAALR